jgi:glycosyltransferase involved in cell wall biosynthesis
MNKLLTIAIPTYNRADLLDKQLAWLAKAIHGFEADCEIFVSDNCSTDHTQDILHKWQEILTDIPFTNNKNSKNIGLKENIAHCINSAKTKYVWTVGDDDPIRHSAFNYVFTKLRGNEDISILFLNFQGCDKTTGQPINPCGDSWFNAYNEDGGGNSKELFEHCYGGAEGAVIFITASVYRTVLAQKALQNWKNSTDNWMFLAYVSGYCAANGSMVVSKDIYVTCVINSSSWQQEQAVDLIWKHKHRPELLMKLKTIGYSDKFCNRLIVSNLSRIYKSNLKAIYKMKFFLDDFKKHPILVVKLYIYSFLTGVVSLSQLLLRGMVSNKIPAIISRKYIQQFTKNVNGRSKGNI